MTRNIILVNPTRFFFKSQQVVELYKYGLVCSSNFTLKYKIICIYFGKGYKETPFCNLEQQL